MESYKLNNDNNRNDKHSTSHKHDNHGSLTSRQTERPETSKIPTKIKKSTRSESTSNLLKERERTSKISDYDLYPEERMSNLRVVTILLVLFSIVLD